MRLSLVCLLEAAIHPKYKDYQRAYSSLKSSVERHEQIANYLKFEENGVDDWFAKYSRIPDWYRDQEIYEKLIKTASERLEPNFEKFEKLWDDLDRQTISIRKKAWDETDALTDQFYQSKAEWTPDNPGMSMPDFHAQKKKIEQQMLDQIKPIKSKMERVSNHIINIRGQVRPSSRGSSKPDLPKRLLKKSVMYRHKIESATLKLSHLPLYDVWEAYLDETDDYDGVLQQTSYISSAINLIQSQAHSTFPGGNIRMIHKHINKITDENF